MADEIRIKDLRLRCKAGDSLAPFLVLAEQAGLPAQALALFLSAFW